MVTALDAYGNVATGYLGTVHFSSSGPENILTTDYTLTAADGGMPTFTVTLKKKSTRTITVGDKANKSVTGSACVAVV